MRFTKKEDDLEMVGSKSTGKFGGKARREIGRRNRKRKIRKEG